MTKRIKVESPVHEKLSLIPSAAEIYEAVPTVSADIVVIIARYALPCFPADLAREFRVKTMPLWLDLNSRVWGPHQGSVRLHDYYEQWDMSSMCIGHRHDPPTPQWAKNYVAEIRAVERGEFDCPYFIWLPFVSEVQAIMHDQPHGQEYKDLKSRYPKLILGIESAMSEP